MLQRMTQSLKEKDKQLQLLVQEKVSKSVSLIHMASLFFAQKRISVFLKFCIEDNLCANLRFFFDDLV